MEQHDDNSQITITLPEEVIDRLQREADKHNQSLNSYIIGLLANRPKKEKPE